MSDPYTRMRAAHAWADRQQRLHYLRRASESLRDALEALDKVHLDAPGFPDVKRDLTTLDTRVAAFYNDVLTTPDPAGE